MERDCSPSRCWSGLGLPAAITVSTVTAGSQMLLGIWRYRREIPWKPILPLVFYRFVTLPLGVMLLGVVVLIGREAVQQAVGWGLLTVVVLMQVSKVRPRQHVAAGWGAASGLSSGFLSGLLGMGGPPVVLWVMAHDWAANRARAAIWVINGVTLPVVLGLLGWEFGSHILGTMAMGLICVPFALIGAFLGLRFNAVLSGARLRRASVAMLILIAAGAILKPMFQGRPDVQIVPAAKATPHAGSR